MSLHDQDLGPAAERDETDEKILAGRQKAARETSDWNERVKAIRAENATNGASSTGGNKFANSDADQLRKPDAKKTADTEELRNRERSPSQGYGSGNRDGRERLGLGYTDDSNIRVNTSRKKQTQKLTAAAGGLLLGIIGLVVAFMFMVSSLQIPHLMENVTEYEFARLTRQVAIATSETAQESLAIKATNSALYKSMQERYGNLRGNTWGKLDKIRPEKVMQNLGKTNDLTLYYGPEELTIGGKKIKTGRTVFQAAEMDGKKYTIPSSSSWKPWVGLKNQANVWRQFDSSLTEAMAANDTGPIVRGLVARKLRQEIGVSMTGWLLAKYMDKAGKPLTSDAAILAETREQISVTERAGSNITNNTTTGELKDAEDKVKQAEKEVIDDDKKLMDAIKNGGVSDEAVESLSSSLDSSTAKEALGVLNPAYALLVPACIIFDGSMTQAGPTIDKQTSQQQALFYSFAAKGHQQKYGAKEGDDPEALAVAVGAANDSLGDINDSNPVLRANGDTYDTTQSSSAEANAMGSFDYSMLNALASYSPVNIPSGFLALLNDNISGTCAVLTDFKVAAGLGLANLAVAIMTFGGSEVAEVAASQGMAAVVKLTAKKMATRMFSRVVEKNGIKVVARESLSRVPRYLYGGTKFLTKEGLKVGATVGLTELAKMVVLSRASLINSGMAQGVDLVNSIDSGGNIAAGELSRKAYYGRPLSKTETNQSDVENAKFLTAKNAQESAFTRYLAIENADSLVARFAQTVRGNLGRDTHERLLRVAGSIFNPFSYAGAFLSRASPAVGAASQPDAHYNNVQFGWSEVELKLMKDDQQYSTLINQSILEGSGQEDAIDDEYGVCFTKTLGELLSEGLIVRDDTGTISETEGLCAPRNLSFNNPKYGDLVFRWRLSKMKPNIIDQLSGLAGDQQEGVAE